MEQFVCAPTDLQLKPTGQWSSYIFISQIEPLLSSQLVIAEVVLFLYSRCVVLSVLASQTHMHTQGVAKVGMNFYMCEVNEDKGLWKMQ